jgi:predicted TPR repeat methyltransferase
MQLVPLRTGLLAQMICKQGYKAKNFDGMDLSPKMLEHLVKKGIYTEVKAHDMMQYPWPFASNKYDGLMCNGVLIYVDDPAVGGCTMYQSNAV